MKRTSEKMIALAIVTILKRRIEHSATVRDLIERIPSVIKLTRADKQRSTTRPAEALWEQRVRNLVSHRSFAPYGLSWNDGWLSLTIPARKPSRARPATAREARI